MSKSKKKRMASAIAVLTAVLVMACALPAVSYAQRVTDTISIYVGYEGGPYALKATYSWRDLDDLYGGALPTVNEVYSYYGVGRTAVDSARGFYLTDLLDYAGVDVASIYSLAFYTDDKTTGAFTSFTKAELIDKPRYYYPNLAADEETETVYARDGGDIESGAVRVEPMMALEDSWEWDAVGENFTSLNAANRFHLLFGQAYPSEHRSNQAAKYVNSIYVTFSGTPTYGDSANLSLKVGSDYSLSVDVTAADKELENLIRNNLTWTSDNPDVLSVDENGRVTLGKDGSAVITVSYGNLKDSVTLSVGGGSVTGSEDAADAAVGSGTDTSSLEEGSSVLVPVRSSKDVYILPQSVINRQKLAMSEDAEQLIMEEEEEEEPRALVGAALAGMLALGLIYGLIRYVFCRRFAGIRISVKPLLKYLPLKEGRRG